MRLRFTYASANRPRTRTTGITTTTPDTSDSRNDRDENPVRFGVLTAIGVTLLFQFGAQLVLLRYSDPSLLPFIMAISQLTLMLVPAIYAARAQELPVRELFRLHKVTPGYHLAVIIGIVALWPVVQSYLIVQELYFVPEGWYDEYRQMQERLQEMYERLMPVGGVFAPMLAIFAAALVPAVCEEVVFRGAAQRSFERRMRPAFAIVTCSLLFAALHLHPFNFIPLLILGAFLGLVAWSSNSVYPVIVGHFFFNALMIGALYTMRATGDRPSPHSETDLFALLPGVAICVVALTFIVRWLMQRGREREKSTSVAMPIAAPSFEERRSDEY